MQIFAARPLFPHLRTTPLAGSWFTSHLRALLLLFGTYISPPLNLSSVNPPLSSRVSRVPQEILTDALVEDIKTRCCFVSSALEINRDSTRSSSPPPAPEPDLPPSSDVAMSESEFSHASEGVESGSSSQHASSELEAVSLVQQSEGGSEGHLQVLANMYTRHSTATDIRLRVVPPASQQLGTGRGTLIIPGWIRERAAEVLFEGGDVDESSVAEVILETLLKVIPIHLLRHTWPVLSAESRRYRSISGKRSCPRYSSRAAQRCCRALSHGSTLNCCVPLRRRRQDHARGRRGRAGRFPLRTIAMLHSARSSLTSQSSITLHHNQRRHRARRRTLAKHLRLPPR